MDTNLDTSSPLFGLYERIGNLEANQDSINSMLNNIQGKVDSFHDDMTRYKGMLGAAAFIASGILTCLTLLKSWIMNHWHS